MASNSPARALIEIFREWNRQWELYDKDQARPKPVSADELAREIDSAFTVTQKTGE